MIVLGHHRQVRPPHVARDVLQLARATLAKDPEESLECILRPILADPQESTSAGIDLVDQGQVAMSLARRHFVDADRVNP